jgi:hypothetical protein
MDLQGTAHPQPASKNIYKNLGTFFLLPTLHCLLRREASPKAQKKEKEGGSFST